MSDSSQTEIQELLEIAGYTPDPEGKPLHFYAAAILRIGALLWSNRWYIGRIVLIAVVIAAGATMLLPTRFVAVAYLMPPDNTSGMSGLSLLMGMRGSDSGRGVGNQIGTMLGMPSPTQLYVRALQSNRVEDRMIERFDLLKVYQTKLRSSARQRLEDNTEVSEERKSGVISIAVTDSDPTRAAQMANAYWEELDRLLLEVNTNAAKRERQYDEEQLALAKMDLQKAAKEFGDFAGKNVAIDVPEQGRAAVESMAALQGQLIAAETQLKGLLQVYNEDQGPVRLLRAQIGELRRQLAQLAGKTPANNDALPDLKRLSSLGGPYLDLYQRLRVQQAVVEVLSQQYQLAKLQEVREVPSIRVMDVAEVPERKSFPPRAMIVVLCAFLGFCFATTKVLLRRWWSQADPEDPWKKLLTPMVGHYGDSPKSADLSRS